MAADKPKKLSLPLIGIDSHEACIMHKTIQFGACCIPISKKGTDHQNDSIFKKNKKMIAFNIIIVIFGMLSSASNPIQPRYNL